MKFSKVIILTILSIITLCSFEVKSTDSKRSETVMEYLGNLFSTKNTYGLSKVLEQTTNQEQSSSLNKKRTYTKAKKNKALKKKKSKKHKHKKNFRKMRFAQQAPPTNSTGAGNNANASGNGSLENIQDWLMVGSPAFRNTARFPPVHLLNGSIVNINIDDNFFRLNNANCTPETAPPARRYFWFRLFGPNLYYSSSKTDINILGAIQIKSISSVSDVNDNTLIEGNKTHCFDIEDTEQANWKLCAQTIEIARKWVCAIKKGLNPADISCLNYANITQDNTTIIEKTINQPIIIIPLPSRQCNEKWNYQQNGADWECDCSEGREQSPIDLPEKNQAIDSPVKPLFQYVEIEPKFTFSTIDTQMVQDETLKLKLSDHAFRIFHHNMGKAITLDGAIYYAEEIVIHTPAEHKINGKEYEMEIQIIHYGQTKGDIAKQLVLSFVIERTPGSYNQFFDDLDFFNLPNPISKEREIQNKLFIPKLLYSSETNDIAIMKPFSFYTYQGSLTFPPCTERTIMYVASTPIKLGSTAIQLFQEALRVPDMMDDKGNVIVSNWLPVSNRAIQELNGRPVFHYDADKYCGPEPAPPAPQPVGHYEKVIRKATQYFYVNGEKPSGLPGAFVVSEKEAKGQFDPNTPGANGNNNNNNNGNNNISPLA